MADTAVVRKGVRSGKQRAPERGRRHGSVAPLSVACTSQSKTLPVCSPAKMFVVRPEAWSQTKPEPGPLFNPGKRRSSLRALHRRAQTADDSRTFAEKRPRFHLQNTDGPQRY